MRTLARRFVPALLVAAAAAFGPATLSAQSAPAPAPAAALEGVYDVQVVESSMGPTNLTMTITRENGRLVVKSEGGDPMSIGGIEVNGQDVVLQAAYDGNPIPLPGKITAEGMSGNWSVEGFGGPWKATRRRAQP